MGHIYAFGGNFIWRGCRRDVAREGSHRLIVPWCGMDLYVLLFSSDGACDLEVAVVDELLCGGSDFDCADVMEPVFLYRGIYAIFTKGT